MVVGSPFESTAEGMTDTAEEVMMIRLIDA